MIEDFLEHKVKLFLKNSLIIEGILKDVDNEIVVEDNTGLFYISKSELLHYKVFRPEETVQQLEERQQIVSDQVQVITGVSNPDLSELAKLRQQQAELDKELIRKRSHEVPAPKKVKYGNQFDILTKQRTK